jgi:hypothetical protein
MLSKQDIEQLKNALVSATRTGCEPATVAKHESELAILRERSERDDEEKRRIFAALDRIEKHISEQKTKNAVDAKSTEIITKVAGGVYGGIGALVAIVVQHFITKI